MSTIYQVLKKEHDSHRELLKKISETQGDSQERRELWQQFYFDVKSHAAAEEESFYSKLMAHPDGQDLARHSVSEHKELDDLIEELSVTDFTSPQWLVKLKQIRHDYEHHVDEEETDIFPCGREIFDDIAAQDMAERFLSRKASERKLVKDKADNKLTV